MRNPHRRKWLFLAAAGLGLVTFAGLLVAPTSDERSWLAPTAAAVAMVCVIFGSLFAAWAHKAARVRAALLRDEDVLGRWTVDADTWRQFVALNRTFSHNGVAVPEAIPAGGLEIIIGPRGLLMGEYVSTFNRSARMNGVVRHWGGDWTIHKVKLGGEAPCCLYLYASMKGDHGAATFTNMILPVPTVARPAATVALNDFQSLVDASRPPETPSARV